VRNYNLNGRTSDGKGTALPGSQNSSFLVTLHGCENRYRWPAKKSSSSSSTANPAAPLLPPLLWGLRQRRCLQLRRTKAVAGRLLGNGE